MVLLNFFLAIILNANAIADASVKDLEADNSLVYDLYDLVYSAIVVRWRKWPGQWLVLAYLQGDGGDGKLESMPAITCEELFAHIVDMDGNRCFENKEHAAAYIRFYLRKVVVDDDQKLEETRLHFACKIGSCYSKGGEDPIDQTVLQMAHEEAMAD